MSISTIQIGGSVSVLPDRSPHSASQWGSTSPRGQPSIQPRSDTLELARDMRQMSAFNLRHGKGTVREIDYLNGALDAANKAADATGTGSCAGAGPGAAPAARQR
jgi:hypothetical protein